MILILILSANVCYSQTTEGILGENKVPFQLIENKLFVESTFTVNGIAKSGYFIVDTGSEASFVTEKFIQSFNIKQIDGELIFLETLFTKLMKLTLTIMYFQILK